MIELIQFPWSPFCIVQRRILEYSGAAFKIVDIPCTDRRLVWKLTKARYYQVPIVRHGASVVFETGENSQVIAKCLDEELDLGLFPPKWRGVQTILWRHIESEIEECAFKLNDVYWEEIVPKRERLGFLRHKERKFGAGCLERWKEAQPFLLEELERRLNPFEHQLLHQSYLLGSRPLFVDFDLFGMLGNFLYSGHYQLPAAHARLRDWQGRMAQLKAAEFAREKLHS